MTSRILEFVYVKPIFKPRKKIDFHTLKTCLDPLFLQIIVDTMFWRFLKIGLCPWYYPRCLIKTFYNTIKLENYYCTRK